MFEGSRYSSSTYGFVVFSPVQPDPAFADLHHVAGDADHTFDVAAPGILRGTGRPRYRRAPHRSRLSGRPNLLMKIRSLSTSPVIMLVPSHFITG